MRALVTGASGFVGSHLTAHLEAAGDQVLSSETELGRPDSLGEEFAGYRPEVVYHLAAWADVGGSWKDPLETLRVNVEGTFNVIDASRRAGVQRLLVVSSADVYGAVTKSDLPLTESSPLRPISPYAASKAAAELLCLQANLGQGRGVIRVRAFNHLGPGQSDRFVASALAARIAANEGSGAGAVGVGNLAARRDFSDVRDVVRAYRLLARHGSMGEVYNVCSGVDRPVSELAEILLAQARHPMRLEANPELLRPIDVEVLRGDPTKLRAATGWEPEIAISSTLRDLLEYWRAKLLHDTRPAAASCPQASP